MKLAWVCQAGMDAIGVVAIHVVSHQVNVPPGQDPQVKIPSQDDYLYEFIDS